MRKREREKKREEEKFGQIGSRQFNPHSVKVAKYFEQKMINETIFFEAFFYCQQFQDQNKKIYYCVLLSGVFQFPWCPNFCFSWTVTFFHCVNTVSRYMPCRLYNTPAEVRIFENTVGNKQGD